MHRRTTDKRRAAPRAAANDRGISTVEFAIGAPVLIFGLMATTDIGLAVHERMTLDHVLRAGAQAAMQNGDAEDIIDILEATAASHFALSAPDQPLTDTTVEIDAVQHCSCPEDTGTEVACATTCTGSVPTSMFYEVTASKTYSGMLLPSIALSTVVQIQIR